MTFPRASTMYLEVVRLLDKELRPLSTYCLREALCHEEGKEPVGAGSDATGDTGDLGGEELSQHEPRQRAEAEAERLR